MFMNSEGEEAVELSLERMKTRRSSGRHSKRSGFFLVCLNGALMVAKQMGREGEGVYIGVWRRGKASGPTTYHKRRFFIFLYSVINDNILPVTAYYNYYCFVFGKT